jgi:hypothetical protein
MLTATFSLALYDRTAHLSIKVSRPHLSIRVRSTPVDQGSRHASRSGFAARQSIRVRGCAALFAEKLCFSGQLPVAYRGSAAVPGEIKKAGKFRKTFPQSICLKEYKANLS